MLYQRSSMTLEILDENRFMVIGGFASSMPIETGIYKFLINYKTVEVDLSSNTVVSTELFSTQVSTGARPIYIPNCPVIPHVIP
jgi:hypothetical protein